MRCANDARTDNSASCNRRIRDAGVQEKSGETPRGGQSRSIYRLVDLPPIGNPDLVTVSLPCRVRSESMATHGSITTADVLVVGEHGTIHADIKAGEVQIYGAVFGNIESNRRVEIYSTGRLHGDVRTPQLVIEEGSVFEGRCRGTSDDETEELAPDFAPGQATKTSRSAKTKKEFDWPDSLAP